MFYSYDGWSVRPCVCVRAQRSRVGFTCGQRGQCRRSSPGGAARGEQEIQEVRSQCESEAGSASYGGPPQPSETLSRHQAAAQNLLAAWRQEKGAA